MTHLCRCALPIVVQAIGESHRCRRELQRLLDPAASSKEMLDFYFKPYLQFARTPDQVCLCGALAGEVLALPPEMRKGVDRFFVAHQQWLVAILKRGVARGEFSLAAPPMKTARLFFGETYDRGPSSAAGRDRGDPRATRRVGVRFIFFYSPRVILVHASGVSPSRLPSDTRRR